MRSRRREVGQSRPGYFLGLFLLTGGLPRLFTCASQAGGRPLRLPRPAAMRSRTWMACYAAFSLRSSASIFSNLDESSASWGYFENPPYRPHQRNALPDSFAADAAAFRESKGPSHLPPIRLTTITIQGMSYNFVVSMIDVNHVAHLRRHNETSADSAQ